MLLLLQELTDSDVLSEREEASVIVDAIVDKQVRALVLVVTDFFDLWYTSGRVTAAVLSCPSVSLLGHRVSCLTKTSRVIAAVARLV